MLRSPQETTTDQTSRSCSNLGYFIRERHNWELQSNRNATQKKGLGLVGLSMLLIAAFAFCSGWMLTAAVLTILGVGITGYIPWLTLPNQPITKHFMPQEEFFEKQTTLSGGFQSRYNPRSESPQSTSSDSDGHEISPRSMLESAGGEAASLSFRNHVANHKPSEESEDTLDLVRKCTSKGKRALKPH